MLFGLCAERGAAMSVEGSQVQPSGGARAAAALLDGGDSEDEQEAVAPSGECNQDLYCSRGSSP